MLLQLRELGKFRSTEYGEDNWDPTPDRFGSVQSGLGGNKETFERFTTRCIRRFPGDYGSPVMEDLYGSTL